MFAVILYSLIFVGSCFATTIRVPADFPLIQSAVNASVTGDTVLISLGIYPEAIIISDTRHIVIKGDVVPDTGNYSRPVIDPSSLPGSDSLACLKINGQSRLVIEDLVFRNGPQMYSGRGYDDVGGIKNSSADLTIRRCLFDSTYIGIGMTSCNLTLEQTHFYKNRRFCAWIGYSTGRMIATECDFWGNCEYQVQSADSSQFINCHFHQNHSINPNGPLLGLYGRGVTVANCLFDSSDSPYYAAIENLNFISGRIDSCVFADLTFGLGACYVTSHSAREDTVYFRGNHFLRCHNNSFGGSNALTVHYSHDSSGFSGVIRDNLFEACSGNPLIKALSLSFGTAYVHHNRFCNMFSLNKPTVMPYECFPLIRDNFFDSTGYALAVHIHDTLYVPFNWWGSDMGPYHPILNPFSNGDAIGNMIQPFPWYTDTSFFNLSADKPRIPHPSAFSLSVYPNPFNSTAKIKLEVPEPMIVKVELFDLLGRKVKELYNAPVAYEKEISFQADNLSSGVYFVRAKDTIWNRPLGTKKLLLMK